MFYSIKLFKKIKHFDNFLIVIYLYFFYTFPNCVKIKSQTLFLIMSILDFHNKQG